MCAKTNCGYDTTTIAVNANCGEFNRECVCSCFVFAVTMLLWFYLLLWKIHHFWSHLQKKIFLWRANNLILFYIFKFLFNHLNKRFKAWPCSLKPLTCCETSTASTKFVQIIVTNCKLQVTFFSINSDELFFLLVFFFILYDHWSINIHIISQNLIRLTFINAYLLSPQPGEFYLKILLFWVIDWLIDWISCMQLDWLNSCNQFGRRIEWFQNNQSLF